MVTGTNDPALLGPVIADLQAVAGEVPAGKARWTLRTILADALDSAGYSDRALTLFEQAAEEADAAKHWADVNWICHNWANALGDVGQLDRARETYLRSADAKCLAGSPRVLVIMSELEVLRVDVMQGRAGEALAAVEEKLAEVRGWWTRREKGELVPEAPDVENLARALVGGLDVAGQANLALKRWQACLDLLVETEKVQRVRGAGEHELARTRFNACGPLQRLGKLAEAKAVLEGCLEIDGRAEDVSGQAADLSALADLWDDLGDPRQAAALARRALALRERLPDPAKRAISHHNLANYLRATGAPAEAGTHQLADLIYTLATGLDLRDSLRNLAVDIREAATRNARYDLPRMADVLADPAFAPLRAFLEARRIPPADLQAAIDARVEQVRAAVAAEAAKPPEPA
jgi:tetratricopeptide (TPR) repeat protein